MGLLKQLEKAAESNDDKTIVELYLAIVDASKVFKTHLATFFNQQSNLSEFDRYGKFSFSLHFPMYIFPFNPRIF